jgi:hypothetical protein
MLPAAATPLLVCVRERWAGILALGAFFLLHPVVSNTAFLKNDPMGLLFAALAVIAAWRSRGEDIRWIALSSALAVIAFFSKQYFIAPAASCTLCLPVRSPRRGLLHGAFTAGLLAGGLALSFALWGSGFFFCVFEAVRNPIGWSQFHAQWASMLKQPGFVVL